jgi:hypothetical protein
MAIVRDEWHRSWSLVFPANYRRRWIVMLRAYCDASNTHDGTNILSLAGFLAPLGAWDSFRYGWRNALAGTGVEVFHMTDYVAAQSPPYRDWTERRRAAILSDLVEATTSRISVSIACTLDRGEYSNLRDAGRFPEVTEYGLCASAIIGRVAGFLREEGSPEDVAYVFEAGSDSAQYVHIINNFMARSHYAEMFAVNSVHAEKKKIAVGLQAADILAHTIARYIRIDQIPPEPLRSLVDKTIVIYEHLGRKELEELAVQFTPEQMAARFRTIGFQKRPIPSQRKHLPGMTGQADQT